MILASGGYDGAALIVIGVVAGTMCLAVGVMMGAPLGATLSTRLQGSLIVRLLAVALCLVGFRLLLAAIW